MYKNRSQSQYDYIDTINSSKQNLLTLANNRRGHKDKINNFSQQPDETLHTPKKQRSSKSEAYCMYKNEDLHQIGAASNNSKNKVTAFQNFHTTGRTNF